MRILVRYGEDGVEGLEKLCSYKSGFKTTVYNSEQNLLTSYFVSQLHTVGTEKLQPGWIMSGLHLFTGIAKVLHSSGASPL